jgi:hypothetical protein
MSKLLQWKLFIRKRASATQGVPLGKDDLKWVANTTTLIYGEQEALLVDTFLSDAQTAELADWIAATGRRLSTIYITMRIPTISSGFGYSCRPQLRHPLPALAPRQSRYNAHSDSRG